MYFFKIQPIVVNEKNVKLHQCKSNSYRINQIEYLYKFTLFVQRNL